MTLSSDSETRAREDLCGIDFYSVSVSSKHVERKERGHPLTKPTQNPKLNKNEDHDSESSPKQKKTVVFRHPGVTARIHRKSCE